MRLLHVVALLTLVVVGCGTDYEDENQLIVAELPMVDGVERLSEEYYRYCTQDSCWLGNDRAGALVTYTVDTSRYTMMELAESYRDALPDWDPVIGEGCLNADESFCEEIVFASFNRGDQEINLNLDNWSAGRFEIAVDARGGE